MATPKQLAVASLRVAVETCTAALHSISTTGHDTDGAELTTLQADWVSILSLLYGSTTKLALALKPSSPTHSAALSPLKDICDKISALSHCVALLELKHGSTLIQEITSIAEHVIESVRSLLQTFLDIETSDRRQSTGKAGDEYMVRIGTVHETIENARSNLSRDNIAAVRKKLAQNQDSLEDGLQEVDEMTTDQEPIDDWEDDGWGELGVDSKKRLDSDEIERAQKVHAILRMSTLLHKRIMKDILSPPPHSSLKSSASLVQHVDSLVPQSSALLVASDDLVATLYPPQNPSDISTELAAFMDVIKNLRSFIVTLLQELTLAEQMEAMRLQGGGVSQKDPKRWFEACFVQIQRAASTLDSTLNKDG
ncbi:hypothetical protein LshimejAT787_0205210 [Lyophyllum shimeji]|uniref:Uncharacterized protein n=1 Tax=Lyophyllum shimeji TaxID=47721 RepID=A0A9P3PFJ9_LYOSH|nr:hypothetical protein LshimejAT787_0205210 [Lyophyllum shimeji]